MRDANGASEALCLDVVSTDTRLQTLESNNPQSTMLQLLNRLLGRRTKPELPPFDFARNRFRAKKKWPPNMRTLTEKQQFRFERKFKRRLRMKAIKPQWQRWTKIVQWSAIGFVTVYGVFFHDFAKDPMNPRPGEQPFKGLRDWVKRLGEGIWTHTATRERGGRRLRREELEGEEGGSPRT